MPDGEFDVVTGAFGYTGRHIAAHLLAMGRRVVTLTHHTDRSSPFGDQVAALPFNFDDPQALADSLRGASTVYNTYWVRFPRGDLTYERAVANTQTLIRAAEAAGVRCFVHISVTNAAEDLPLPYFRGKGLVEKAVINSNLPYAIIRPTLIFGAGDILINNIAWLLRRFPLFTILGAGDYRLQPVYAGDVAEIAVSAADKGGNVVVDAAGPDFYTFQELVRLIARKIGSRARLVHLPPTLAFPLIKLIGCAVRDVVLTRGEAKGLMASLLVSEGPPTGTTRFSDWLEQNASTLGVRYASELERHYR